jgi:hypothetical protein
VILVNNWNWESQKLVVKQPHESNGNHGKPGRHKSHYGLKKIMRFLQIMRVIPQARKAMILKAFLFETAMKKRGIRRENKPGKAAGHEPS